MRKLAYYQICAGLLIWLFCILLLPIGYIEKLILFSFFVTIPAFLYMINLYNDQTTRLFKIIQSLILPMSIASAIAFSIPEGALAGILSLGWMLVAFLIGFYGLLRFLSRGFYLLEEFCIDAGLMYLPIGGLWLICHRFGLEIGGFNQLIILLTVAHFQFSFFTVPIFTGLAGRLLKITRLYKWVAVANVVNPMLVAIGITYSRNLELISVLLFFSSLLLYSYFSIKLSLSVIRNKYARYCLILSSCTLVVTVIFALCYGIGRGLGFQLVSIPTMVAIHGTGNVFGFVLFGLLAWGMVHPKPRYMGNKFPHSRIVGQWKIGRDFLKRNQWVDQRNTDISGLVDDFSLYNSHEFNSGRIHEQIKMFYYQTKKFDLHADTRWHHGFVRLSKIYKFFSQKIEQLNLALNGEDATQEMDGDIIPIDSNRDGRDRVRAWVRWDKKTGKTIFVALYSYHKDKKRTYMNIALPLPLGNMTGILRAEHDISDGLILTSLPNPRNKGDEGIYYFWKNTRFRLPINETFHITCETRSIQAIHKMWFLGLPFLTIHYHITKK